MRISVFSLLLLTLFFHTSGAYSIDEELNATLAPGADGRSVYLSTSYRIPIAHSSGGSGGLNAARLSPIIEKYSLPIAIFLDPFPIDRRVPCDPQSFVSTETLVVPVVGPAPGEGTVFIRSLTDRASGENISYTSHCLLPSQARDPNVVSPPTYAQIWNAVYTQAFNDSSISSGAYIAPKSPGLTGLPTNIWAQFPGGQSISRDVTVAGGFRIQATANISEVSISLAPQSGSQSTLVRLVPGLNGEINGGSFENPATVYKFRSTGSYVVSTGVIWSAENATLSGPGIGTIVVPLGSIRLEINRDYEVQELLPAITK